MSLFDSASLVVTPNGTKASKLYAIKPTDGSGDLSVTRATSATRVDANGLVEIPRTNLLLQSQTFDNASWGKTNLTVTSNAVTAPDGTTTADKIIANTTNGTHIVNQFIAVGISTSHTVSLYAKKVEYSALRINFISSGNTFISVNLDTGVIVSFGGTIYLSSSIENVGDGWYRVTMTFLPPVATNSLNFFIENPVGTPTFAGDNTSGIYIWGAQLQLGNVATEYIPTVASIRTKFAGITQDGGSASNIPRLDYTNGSCPSILVEPQRTNLALRSEEFDNASWQKTNSTITANSITAPDGTLSADTLSLVAANSNITQNINSAIGSNTFSVYAKTLSGTKKFRFFRFNATDGLVSSVDFTATTEWQRFTFVTSPSVSISNWYIANTTIGDSGNIYIWGAQLEAGANATSYIPTTSASVTRNADVISKTGISSLIGQTEGTLFADLKFTNVGTEKYILNLKDIAGSNVISFRRLTSGEIRFVLTATTSSGTTNQSTAVLPNGNYKIAYKYVSGSLKIFINGALLFTLTPTFTFGTALSIIEIGNQNSGSQLNDSINLLSIFKTALTDEQCINLTTL